MRLCRYVIPIALMLGCGEQIDRDIAAVIAGGDDAEESAQRLALIKLAQLEPLIAAFEDQSLPMASRLLFADALQRLNMREPDRRIEAAMIKALDDQEATLRAAAVDGLAKFGRRDLVEPVLSLLEREPDDLVRLRIMLAMELFMGLEELWSRRTLETKRMSDDQRDRFTERLLSMLRHEELSDSLSFHTREWLELIMAEKAETAHKLVLGAQMAQAESILVAAREMLPESKHIGFKLGRLYFDHLDREKGIQVLEEAGCLLYCPRLHAAPTIDGDLDDPGWERANRVTEFYSNSSRITSIPSKSRTEAVIGYLDNVFYVGYRGYEADTGKLSTTATVRDEGVWQDDSFDVYMDVNRDGRSFYGILTNAIGTIMDSYVPPDHSHLEFDLGVDYAVEIGENYWFAEFAIPGERMEVTMEPGVAWNVNLVRARMGNESEYVNWKTTHWQANNPDRWGVLIFE